MVQNVHNTWERVAIALINAGFEVVTLPAGKSGNITMIVDYGLIEQIKFCKTKEADNDYRFNVYSEMTMEAREATNTRNKGRTAYHYGYNLIDQIVSDLVREKERLTNQADFDYEKKRDEKREEHARKSKLKKQFKKEDKFRGTRY